MTETYLRSHIEDENHVWEDLADETDRSKYAVYLHSARIYIAFVIGVGIVGNAACLILYRQPTFVRYRSSRYLTALAISDLASLLCLGFVWLKGLGVEWQDRSQFACAASFYVSNSATFLSAWYVMLLTADMAWGLKRPFRVLSMLEDGRSIVGRILAVTFIGLAVNSWTWTAAKINVYETDDSELKTDSTAQNGSKFFHESVNKSIKSSSEFHNRNKIDVECHLAFSTSDAYFGRCMIIFDMMISFTIPLMVTLILNGYIAYKLMMSARQRRRLSSQNDSIRLTEPEMYRFQNILMVTMSSNSRKSGSRTTTFSRKVNCAEEYVPVPISQRKIVRRKRSFFSGMGKEATVSSLLIAKSLAYLIMNLPTHVVRLWSILRTPIGNESRPEMSEFEKDRDFFINMIVYILFYTQFSMNFLLYSGHSCKRRGKY